MSVTIFGVRHHGPGCARSLRDALERLQPDAVLVEGPPDAHAALPLLLREEMKPPVALLIYAPAEPSRAVYYPFTSFSPEWQALRYALSHTIPARFMDLPQAVQLAREPQPATTQPAPDEPQPASPLPLPAGAVDPNVPDPNVPDVKAAEATAAPAPERAGAPDPARAQRYDDPIAMLSEAAGYSDHERWWELQVEQRHNAEGLFEGILEAMTALRADLTPRDDEEAQREAHMRRTIRAAEAEGYTRIAVVCGAWHAPALIEQSAPEQVAADEALLAGLKTIAVEATWIPWTNSRLAYRTGYGAGVQSPGWYEHLWSAPDRLPIRWMTQAARLLRQEGLDASSASVIEAVRLSEALAALRDEPMPGLDEMHEATLTVLCNGEDAPMKLIRDKLEIGERMGEVPPDTPAVPLQRDLTNIQRALNLKPSPEATELDLDIRNIKNTLDRARSQLLHRLRLLGIEWGKPHARRSRQGDFHECWTLQWRVEFIVRLIEANIWGNTVVSATTAYAIHQAETLDELPDLTKLLDQVILAELPDAVNAVLARVEARAVAADVRALMEGLPPLARVTRYGDVRGTRPERIQPVIANFFERIVIGLPGACASLDDQAAQAMVGAIDAVQSSLDMLHDEAMYDAWRRLLRGLVDRDGVHGFVRGRCCRLLLEQRALDDAELQRLARLALSKATPAPQAAAWVEGVLRGSGLVLLHQDGLWRALDGWLVELDGDTFVALLPLLRRAFSGFQPPERREMGRKIKTLRASDLATPQGQQRADEQSAVTISIHAGRAALVLPALAQIVGVSYGERE